MENLKEINGTFYKECRVVMLPAEKANIISCNSKRLLVFDKSTVSIGGYTSDEIFTPQHLYIISPDEEIKEGDWYAVELFDVTSASTGIHLEQCKSIDDVWVNKPDVDKIRHIGNCKKIIATTDKELHAIKFRDTKLEAPSKYLKGIAVIPQLFIDGYISEYNKGNIIAYMSIRYIERSYK